MILLGFVVGLRLVVDGRRLVVRTRWFESLSALAVDGLRVVAGAEVLVEDGAVAAVEGLLAAVRVAEVIDLKDGLIQIPR